MQLGKVSGLALHFCWHCIHGLFAMPTLILDLTCSPVWRVSFFGLNFKLIFIVFSPLEIFLTWQVYINIVHPRRDTGVTGEPVFPPAAGGGKDAFPSRPWDRNETALRRSDPGFDAKGSLIILTIGREWETCIYYYPMASITGNIDSKTFLCPRVQIPLHSALSKHLVLHEKKVIQFACVHSLEYEVQSGLLFWKSFKYSSADSYGIPILNPALTLVLTLIPVWTGFCFVLNLKLIFIVFSPSMTPTPRQVYINIVVPGRDVSVTGAPFLGRVL